MSEVLQLSMPHEEVAQAVRELAAGGEGEVLRLASKRSLERGEWVRFEVTLRDGTTVLEGVGRCDGSLPRGNPIDRYDVDLSQLQFDTRNEIMFERLMLARDALEGGFDTGTVDLTDSPVVDAAIGAAANAVRVDSVVPVGDAPANGSRRPSSAAPQKPPPPPKEAPRRSSAPAAKASQPAPMNAPTRPPSGPAYRSSAPPANRASAPPSKRPSEAPRRASTVPPPAASLDAVARKAMGSERPSVRPGLASSRPQARDSRPSSAPLARTDTAVRGETAARGGAAVRGTAARSGTSARAETAAPRPSERPSSAPLHPTETSVRRTSNRPPAGAAVVAGGGAVSRPAAEPEAQPAARPAPEGGIALDISPELVAKARELARTIPASVVAVERSTWRREEAILRVALRIGLAGLESLDRNKR